VITTHALFALKVQRKVSNGVAGLAAGDAARWPTSARRTLAEDPASTRPELRIPNAAAQTRVVSGG
jgi:hypothetical protein